MNDHWTLENRQFAYLRKAMLDDMRHISLQKQQHLVTFGPIWTSA